MMTVGAPITITPPWAVWSPMRAAGIPLIITFVDPMTIESGMCLAVHPNYELPNLFMIICDNYIVAGNGTERIHKTERKIFEV